jgi:hypothetical protein
MRQYRAGAQLVAYFASTPSTQEMGSASLDGKINLIIVSRTACHLLT